MSTKKKTSIKILLVILVIVVAFIAGISGEIITKLYLSKISFLRDLYFTDLSNLGQKDIIIQEAKTVVVEQDLRVEQLKNSLQPVVVGIYKAKKQSQNSLDNVYLPADYLGQAMVLTSDGWLITTSNVASSKTNLVAVPFNKKIYPIEDLIIDQATDIVFLKIKAQNLPIINFEDSDNLLNGQQVLVYNIFSDRIQAANILEKRYQAINNKYDYLNSSEALNRLILLDQSFAANYQAAPVFDFNGQIVGVLVNRDKQFNQVIPIQFISPIINQVLKGEQISRPYLGINYLNIASTYGLSEETRQNQEKGALILADLKGVAIKADSPLKDKLQSGDIILQIEDQVIDQDQCLADILLEYKSGQQLNLKYLRDNQTQDLIFTLK